MLTLAIPEHLKDTPHNKALYKSAAYFKLYFTYNILPTINNWPVHLHSQQIMRSELIWLITTKHKSVYRALFPR